MTKEITKGSYNSTTKQQLFDAYNEVLAQLKAAKAAKHDPAAEVKAKRQAETVTTAEKIVNLSIEEQVASLQKNVVSILGNLQNSFAEEIKSFNTLQEAIDLKKAELKEVHEIEAEAFTLAALLNSHQEIQAKFDAEQAEKKAAAQAQLSEIQAQIVEARQNFETQMRAEREKIAQDRKRDLEEYVYEFNRRKQREKDALADELAAERKEFDEELETLRDELRQDQAAVDAREELVSKREEKMEDLEATVAAFPVKEAQIRAEVAEQVKKDEARTAAIKDSYAKKEAEHQRQLFESKIDLLEDNLSSEKAKVAELQSKLDEAYSKIQAMALASVDGAKTQSAMENFARNFGTQAQK